MLQLQTCFGRKVFSVGMPCFYSLSLLVLTDIIAQIVAACQGKYLFSL